MMDADLRVLLGEVSKLTQDIGRMIGSSRCDLDDLQVLDAALVHVGETLTVIRGMALDRLFSSGETR